MHPLRTALQALLAAERARRHVADVRRMPAFVGHQILPVKRRLSGLSAGLREIGVQRGHHLRAFADGGGDALDRAGAHVADREDAAAVGLERMAPGAHLRPGADEALGVQRDAALRQPVGVRIGADEQEQMADRLRDLLAVARLRQRTVSRLPSRPSSAVIVGAGQHLDVRSAPRCARPDSATCSPRGCRRAPAATPSSPGWPDRRPPGRPNCRRRPAPLPGRRTAALRSARPSSARTIPRTRRGCRRRGGDSARRSPPRRRAPAPSRRRRQSSV